MIKFLNMYMPERQLALRRQCLFGEQPTISHYWGSKANGYGVWKYASLKLILSERQEELARIKHQRQVSSKVGPSAKLFDRNRSVR